MKITLLATPETKDVPGGTLTATHRAEKIIEDVGDRVLYRQEFFILNAGADDDGDPRNYTLAFDRVEEIHDRGAAKDYTALVAADAAANKRQGELAPEDVRAKASEIRGRA
jgi:hypothetical protein